MAATIAPPPGIGPSGVGYVGSSLVAIRRAPAAHRARCALHSVEVERRGGSRRSRRRPGRRRTTSAPRPVAASTIPGPPATSTRSPGSSSVAAATADDTTSPDGFDADRRRVPPRARRAGRRRVVGDEQDAPTRCGVDAATAVDRAGDRIGARATHAIEVAQHHGIAHQSNRHRVARAGELVSRSITAKARSGSNSNSRFWRMNSAVSSSDSGSVLDEIALDPRLGSFAVDPRAARSLDRETLDSVLVDGDADLRVGARSRAFPDRGPQEKAKRRLVVVPHAPHRAGRVVDLDADTVTTQ